MSAAAARAQSALTVNTLADQNDGSCSGTCSLRDAVTQANADNAGDTIVFQSGLTGTITLGSALPGITSTNLTIWGPGANVLTISGAGQYPILWTSGTAIEEWIISGLTFANGNASGSPVSNGGAISGVIVSVSNCAFTGNTATGTGGAIYGEVTVEESTFVGNSALFGGAIGSPVDITVTDSTFSANTAKDGGAIAGFSVTATNSTFSGNSAGFYGGAIVTSDDITANNDIFSGNSTGSAGGALFSDASGATTHNSVFWNNQPSDCGGCSSAPSDASSNPLTLPLANWGGTTTTYLPQPGSAAICAGNLDLAYTAGVINDQRGFPLNTSCVDAGAIQTNYVEVQNGGDSGSGASDCPSGSCTLRDAIAAAGSADGDVYFASGISTVNLNPSNGTLQQSGSIPAVNIIGSGASQLTINGHGSGVSQLSVFTVNGAGQTMALYGLTVTGGFALEGGGISNTDGALTVLDSVVTGNTDAGPISGGAGIWNEGAGLATLTIAGSAITNNFANALAGGIYNGAQATITDSTVSGNFVSYNSGSSEHGGAGIVNAGTMTITESTVYNNSIASTVSSGSGAGIFNLPTATLTVTGSTIANNSDQATSGGSGGGIETASGTLTLTNSIVGGNTAASNSNIDGSYTDNGGNIIGGETNATNSAQNGTGSQIWLTTLPYTNAGASITTLIPTPGDPAICAGLASNIPSGVTTDQRGEPIENTTYPGYSSSTPCVDSGAVQTQYGLQFTTEPQSNVLEYYPLNSPAPVVGLFESGVAFAANSGTVGMTDTSTYLGGTTSEGLSGGSATFGNLAVDPPGNVPASYSNDVLTATLPLDSLVSITTQSSDIQVNPWVVPTVTATVSSGPPSPASSGTLTSPSATFYWNNGTGYTQFRLDVGTIGNLSTNLYSQSTTTNTSVTVPIPAGGVDVFVTLHVYINGQWVPYNFNGNFIEPGTEQDATLTTTAPPGTPALQLTTPSTTFYWNNGNGPVEYQLWVGTTGVGSQDLGYTGVTTDTSATVSIPDNGVKVYITFKQLVNGAWKTTNYTLTEPGTPTPATLTATTTSGVSSSGILNTSPSGSATFYWNNGSGATEYALLLGTTGQGSSNLYNSGNTKLTQATVPVASGGVTVFATLKQEISGAWQTAYSTFTEPGTEQNAVLSTSPTAPATINLTSPDTTFYFINGVGPAEYYLWLGTGTTGATQYNVYKGTAGISAQAAVTTIPDDGITIYATLFQLVNGTWQSSSYTLTAPGSPTYAVLSAPGSNTGTTPPTLLASQQFTWTGGVGPTKYQLLLGTNGAGSSNLYKGADTTNTSATITIPSKGKTVYATLNELFNGTWTSFNYTFTEP